MKKWMKNLYAMLLVVVMIVTMIPTNVLASPRGSWGWNWGHHRQEAATAAAEVEETAPIEAASETSAVSETAEQTAEQANEPASVEEAAPATEETAADETAEAETNTPAEEEAPVAEEPVVEEVTPAPEETAAPEQTEEEKENGNQDLTFDESVSGIHVHVVAPEGAFPEGTTMQVEYVEPDKVQEAVNKAADVDGIVFAAVDISFYQDDIKIDPATSIEVTITSEEIADIINPSVVHVAAQADDIETTEAVAEPISASSESDEVVFEASNFSVYAIIGTGSEADPYTPYRATYEFYNYDGTPYIFKDAANRDQSTQILKDGEALAEVGIPTLGASQNARFIGWYDSNNNEVKIGEKQKVDANKTVRLTAKFQAIINVFFVTALTDSGRSIVTSKQVEYTTGQSSITVDVRDVTTEAPSADQAVVGWSLNESNANNGIIDNDGTIDLTGKTGDVTVFPVIMDAHWLYFNENDGGTGGGASYTAPQFVLANGVTTRPKTDPHRDGYSFGGWYEDEACEKEFTFGKSLATNTTVYAKWNPDAASYTIIVWKQKITDSKDTTNNAEKTYDYVASVSETGKTNEPASVPSNYESFGNNENVNMNGTNYSFVGFHYSHKDDTKTVAADGSTILNVYYDRNLITINFDYDYRASESDTSFTGLYGQNLQELGYTWPTYQTYQGYQYETLWNDGSTVIVFLDAFILPNPKNTTLNLVATAGGDYPIRFYKQNVDGSWPENATNTVMADNGTFYITDKYNGFTALEYRTFSGGWTTQGGWSNSYHGEGYTDTRERTSIWGSYTQYYYPAGTYGGAWTEWVKVGERDSEGIYATVDSGYGELEIRFSRNESAIEFHNGVKNTQGTIVQTTKKLFGASLDDVTPPTVTYPGNASDADHYEFVGWFADPQFTRLVTFTELTEEQKEEYKNNYNITEFTVYSEMPATTLPLYAGWFLIGYDVALNPNGGKLEDSQAGVFWVRYGDKVSSSIVDTTTREGYKLIGWVVSSVENDELIGVYRDEHNHRQVGDFSNWTIGEDPWNFDTGITGRLYLSAKWFSLSTLKVVYDANGGGNPPTDSGAYRDEASTVVFGAPTAPTNKVFLGWDIVGTDEEEKLQPGDTFTVSSEYAVDGIVTLKAVYHEFNPEEEVPVSHITWYANNGTTDHVTDDDLQINKGVDIRPADTFTYIGHTFLGWAKLPEGEDGGMNPDAAKLTENDLFLKYEEGVFKAKNSENQWVACTQVAADEFTPYDDLYAVWKQQYFYVYHSGVKEGDRETIAITAETYDLTKTPRGITKDTLYGGYYLEGGFKAPEDKAAYDGDNWTWTTPETVSGMAITPIADTTYYIKEVPKTYLLVSQFETYNRVTNNLYDFYLLTATDDNNYREVGFTVGASTVTADLYKKITVSYEAPEPGAADGNNNPREINIGDISGANSSGLIGMSNYSLSYDGKTSLSYALRAYWVTPDGVKVNGAKTRRLVVKDKNNDGIIQSGTKTEFIAKDISARITMTDVSASYAGKFEALKYDGQEAGGTGAGSGETGDTGSNG